MAAVALTAMVDKWCRPNSQMKVFRRSRTTNLRLTVTPGIQRGPTVTAIPGRSPNHAASVRADRGPMWSPWKVTLLMRNRNRRLWPRPWSRLSLRLSPRRPKQRHQKNPVAPPTTTPMKTNRLLPRPADQGLLSVRVVASAWLILSLARRGLRRSAGHFEPQCRRSSCWRTRKTVWTGGQDQRCRILLRISFRNESHKSQDALIRQSDCVAAAEAAVFGNRCVEPHIHVTKGGHQGSRERQISCARIGIDIDRRTSRDPLLAA